MSLLCVANWSEGRDIETLTLMRRAMRAYGANPHFEGADVDHNRLVTAFSGGLNSVHDTLTALAEVAFSRIDMRHHEGVHPRVGALDVCPFISLDGGDYREFAVDAARELAENFALPVFLYEKSGTGKHAADLPSLRNGQYEGLLGRTLDPDFGPSAASEPLGVAVVGVRDWLLAVNVDFSESDPTMVRRVARSIRELRDEGDPRFAGVRALGFELKSRGLTQVSMNLTKPDLTPVEAIVDWIETEIGVKAAETELIGVIRPTDILGAARLPIRPEQVVSPVQLKHGELEARRPSEDC